MQTIKRIQRLLDEIERIPERDDAGIITPAGYEAVMQAKAVRECLRIVKEEYEGEV